MKCEWVTCNEEAKPGSVYCFQHGRIYGSKVEKKKQPIAKKSEKRKTEEKEYKKIVKEMFAESNKCELNVPGICMVKAQGLHHMRKRTGKNYLDRKYLKRACNPCNLFCETNPIEAMKLGLVISKFKAA